MSENHRTPGFLGELPGQSAARQSGGAPVTSEAEQEQLSRFLVDFKAGAEPQTTQWIRLASLVASHSFSCDIVIRALGPTERSAKGAGPLDKLAVAIARKTGAKYCPTRLQRSTDGFDSLLKEGVDPGTNDRFAFDKSFLPPKCRVLVVGEPETSPRTFEAIKAAVLDALPEAEVKVFTLAWLEEHVRGAHLDGAYFLSHASPVSALHEGKVAARPSAAREQNAQKGKGAAAKGAAKSGRPKRSKEPVAAAAPAERATERGSSAAGSKRFYLVAVGVIVLLALALLISRNWTARHGSDLHASSELIPSQAQVTPAPRPSERASVPPAPPVARRVEPAKPKGPQGVINVPRAGLRPVPSLDAKPMKGSVRNNEPVTILKRKSSSSGPDWLQIETRSGRVGWVWASVVREVRKKG
jgi:hypothetical protein